MILSHIISLWCHPVPSALGTEGKPAQGDWYVLEKTSAPHPAIPRCFNAAPLHLHKVQACQIRQEAWRRCQFPQRASEAALTCASVSEEPSAKGGRKESPHHCYCRSKKKTEFGDTSPVWLILPPARATSQSSGPCRLFLFLGEAVAVFSVFDGCLLIS